MRSPAQGRTALQTGEAQPATAKTVVCIGAGRRAALLAAIAVAWLAGHPGVLGAQATVCFQNATLSASFSAACSGQTCTFTNTSSLPPVGFSALEWDFGDGAFAQGPPSSTSPIAHTYPTAQIGCTDPTDPLSRFTFLVTM